MTFATARSAAPGAADLADHVGAVSGDGSRPARRWRPGRRWCRSCRTGGTDGALLRANGIPTYGILPLPLSEEDELRMHGDNERTPVASLGWAAEYLFRTLATVAAR